MDRYEIAKGQEPENFLLTRESDNGTTTCDVSIGSLYPNGILADPPSFYYPFNYGPGSTI
jgi:hypothetical protein